MKSIIVGTAGHIDHGKTALVKALTGIDADRLEEEKRRGITIDLGFAHMDLPGANGEPLHLGFVDVPGHERFVRNMLAGVGGIDLVLLVIAADESIKPQTREHFDILQLLGVQRGITVLTKSDAVDAEMLDVVRLEVEEFLRGTFLEPPKSPMVAVSSLTGAGLDDLKQAMIAAAERSAAAGFAGVCALAHRSRVHHEGIWNGGDRNPCRGNGPSRRRDGSLSRRPQSSSARRAGARAGCRDGGRRPAHRDEPGGREHGRFVAWNDSGAGRDIRGDAAGGCAVEPVILCAASAEGSGAGSFPFQHDGDGGGDRAHGDEATCSGIGGIRPAEASAAGALAARRSVHYPAVFAGRDDRRRSGARSRSHPATARTWKLFCKPWLAATRKRC